MLTFVSELIIVESDNKMQSAEFFIEQMMQRESGYAVRNHEQYVFTVRFGSGGVITLYKDWFSGNLPFSLDELTEKAAQAINTMLAGL